MRISLTTLFSTGWKGWQRHQNRFSGLLLPPLETAALHHQLQFPMMSLPSAM